MLESFAKLIRNDIAGTASACASWIAALNHEVVDYPMEDYAVIEVFACKVCEVFDGVGGEVGIKFNGEIAH